MFREREREGEQNLSMILLKFLDDRFSLQCISYHLCSYDLVCFLESKEW